jgi:hypothetical protein
MKKKLLYLVDSVDYVKKNCYQSQLLITLDRHYKIRLLSLDQINSGKIPSLEQFNVILSVLKLRTLDKVTSLLQDQLDGAPVWIYEQDPWEAFIDDSPYKGAYTNIVSMLNVKSFLNTSYWWSEYIKSKGMPSRFVRMGMLPELCEIGKPWEKRSIKLAFQGTLHPHRKSFFDRLKNMGLDVTFIPSSSYKSFLKSLHNIGIYIHTEQSPWVVDGAALNRNALWIKDTEAAARGCFAIRDYEDESNFYNIQELPTIFTFKSINDVPEIVNEIFCMPDYEKNRRMKISVDNMKKRNDWMTVVDAIERIDEG